MEKDNIKMNVELKKWSFNHKESLMAVCNGVDRRFLTNRMPYPYTSGDADWWLNMVEEHDGKDGIFRSISVNGEIIGNISIEQQSDVSYKNGELGYFLLNKYWRKGIMTESVGQICHMAFSKLDIIRITGHVHEPNIASRRVLEKNGFILEGVMRNGVVKDGNICNLCIYGKLK